MRLHDVDLHILSPGAAGVARANGVLLHVSTTSAGASPGSGTPRASRGGLTRYQFQNSRTPTTRWRPMTDADTVVIRSMRALRGPNLYAYMPVLQVTLDI